jgi:hypothetical protein
MRQLKHLLFLLLLFISVRIQLKAQTDNCGTELLDSVTFESQPWFRNNEYLI